ncbi:hypothetical protein TKK_0002844 [Trichogramma kaykai]
MFVQSTPTLDTFRKYHQSFTTKQTMTSRIRALDDRKRLGSRLAFEPIGSVLSQGPVVAEATAEPKNVYFLTCKVHEQKYVDAPNCSSKKPEKSEVVT